MNTTPEGSFLDLYSSPLQCTSYSTFQNRPYYTVPLILLFKVYSTTMYVLYYPATGAAVSQREARAASSIGALMSPKP